MSFPTLTDASVICLKEGSDHKMEFTVISDPSLHTSSRLFFSKYGGSCRKTHVYIEGKEVYFKRVGKGDAGKYTLSTYNVVGKGQASFQLDVKGNCLS